MANDNISIKEQMFCNEYVKNGGNGTKAVISAGYAEQSASVQQTRLLKKDRIQGEIKRQNEFVLRANALSKNQIINEQYQLFILAKSSEEYKTASTILESLTKLLGYAPLADSTKQINHHVKFESLLKDITPINKTISDTYETKLIN
tara:strand:- start:105 stop:545 length:441 start_codon:yes stop_codon:yes gene_type:complete